MIRRNATSAALLFAAMSLVDTAKIEAQQDAVLPATGVNLAPVASADKLQPVHGNQPALTQPEQPVVQTSGATSTNTTATAEAIEVKKEEVASQLRVAMLQEKADHASGPSTGSEPTAETSQVDLLKQIESIVAQQKSANAALADSEAKRVELETQLANVSTGRIDEEPPYSILLLDQIRDGIRNSRAKVETVTAALLAARQSVEGAKRVTDEQAQRIRRLKEIVGPDAMTPEIEAAQLSANLADEILVLRRQELANELAGEQILKLQIEIDTAKVKIIGSAVVFTQQILADKLAEIDERESSLKRKASSLQSELEFAEKRWLVARQELDSTSQPDAALIERVDAVKTAQQTIQNELSVTNQRLGRIPFIRTAWERRYLVVGGQASRNDRRNWLEETKKQQDQLQRERRSHELKIDELRVSQGSVDAKIEAINGENPEARRWLEQKSKSLSKHVDVYNASLLAIDATARSLDRLQLQIEGEPGRTTREFLADCWVWVKQVWNYELANVDDTSVTVGKVLSSVFLMIFGFFTARWLSALFAKRLPQMGIDEAASHAIASLSFYVLLVAVALSALKYANVPLTVFTFLGGALAIGVGFGSQNVMNNFISGLILLAERPIKVGDLISIEGTFGNVTHIGARSTQVRTGENKDIIVPNSKFLENNVINLTRRDDRLRTSICVGVAYGSQLDLVVQLMERAAADEASVHSRPKPMVWFNDFGDNSLVFQLHFWVSARTVAQMRGVETNVRLSIDRLFREHQIVIAFPQRDLHVHTSQPIDFRLVKTDQGGEERLRAAS